MMERCHVHVATLCCTEHGVLLLRSTVSGLYTTLSTRSDVQMESLLSCKPTIPAMDERARKGTKHRLFDYKADLYKDTVQG